MGSGRRPGLLATVPGRLAGLRGAVVTPAPAARQSHSEGDGDAAAWTERVLRSLAAVFLLTWSFRLSGYLTFGTWLAIPVVLLGLTGLLAIVTAWLPRGTLTSRRLRQIDLVVLAAVIVALGVWCYFQIYMAPDYGTDEIAFDQYAAQLALHGINPYVHSMAAAFPLFHVSPNGYTFLLDGRPVTKLSYPALAFEEYLPLLAMGITTQAAVWTDVAAWALGAVVLYAVLPRKLAPLAAIVVSLDVFTGYAVGGVTDFLFMPLLIGAAAGWDRFAWTRGPAAWRGPVLMGLAMAVKQTPWLVLPFVVAGIVMESRRLRDWPHGLRDGLRYVGIATVAFLVPNLPYLLNAPSGWLSGILTPVTAQTVPSGQGLISLSLSLPIGGGSLGDYSAAAIVVFLALLACYLTTYPALKPAAFLLPSIVLFFATRSFGSYLVMLIPAAVAAAATTQRPQLSAFWRHWKWVVSGAAAACALAIIAALTSPSPLIMSIQSVRTTGQLATVDQMTVSVTNTSGHRVRPSFTIEDGTSMTAFWHQLRGPGALGPQQRARYTIQAPSTFAMPSITNGFQVLAFSHTPATVSRTGAYVASVWRVVLQPSTINQPVTVGQTITVHAEIVNRLDQRIRAASVPVYLGQVIYGQGGTVNSEAYVNDGYSGQTPISALTNAQGIATFRITLRTTLPIHNPLYFEANLLNSGSAYPYGYSPILAVTFSHH
ncbi:MAG: hypothetical protein ACR2MP_12595 [Streptosporangiaceae bacterium]